MGGRLRHSDWRVEISELWLKQDERESKTSLIKRPKVTLPLLLSCSCLTPMVEWDAWWDGGMWLEGMSGGREDWDWVSLKDCCSYSNSVKPGPGHWETKPRGNTYAAATMGRKSPATVWHPPGWWRVQLQEQEKRLGALCPWKETVRGSLKASQSLVWF